MMGSHKQRKMKAKSYMGNFEANSDVDLVLKQIKHNCEYWNSDRCKRETVEKYCKAKGVEDPARIIDLLIEKGLVLTPRRDYVGINPREC